MTGSYSLSIIRSPRRCRRRLEAPEEVAHRRADRVEIDEIGKHRPRPRPRRLLHVLAEPAHAPAAGVDMAVGHEVERPQRLLIGALRDIEVAGARLAVREDEQKLIVLGDARQQLHRLLKPRADVRAAARLHAEKLVPALFLRHVLEHDVSPQVRGIAPLQVVPEDEDRLAHEREVLAPHRPRDVEHVDLHGAVVPERGGVLDEIPPVLLHVHVVLQAALLARVAQQALHHGFLEVQIRPETDPVQVVQLRRILGFHLAGPGRLVERGEAQLVEQHLLCQPNELVEVQLHGQLFAVVVAAEQAAECLHLIAARPGRAARPAAPAAALCDVLSFLPELEGRQVERGDLRFHLAVRDQLFLLYQVVQVLLQVVAQQRVVLVLGDTPAMDLHGTPPRRALEAPPDDLEQRWSARRAVPMLLDRAPLQHVEQVAALLVHFFRLLVEAQAVLDLVEHDLVDRPREVLVVAVAHAAQLVPPLQQHVLERDAPLAADLALLYEHALDLVQHLLLAVRQRLAQHAPRRDVEVVEIQVLRVVVEVVRDDLLDDHVHLLVDELHLRLFKELEQVLLIEILDRLVLEGPLHRVRDDLEVDAPPGARVREGECVLEEPRRQALEPGRFLAGLDRIRGGERVDIRGHVLLLAAHAIGALHQGAVDARLTAHIHVVRKVDLVYAAAQRLHDVLGEEHVVLRVVGVADYDRVNVDGRKVGEIDALRLDQLEQEREQLPPALEHLGPVQHAPVRPDHLAFEVVGVRIVRGTALLEHGEVDVADEVRDVFAAEVRGRMLRHADLVPGGDENLAHRDFLPAAVGDDLTLAHRARHRFLVPPQAFRLPRLRRDQVERVLMKRAALDRVQLAVGLVRILFETALQPVHRHGFAGPLRSDEQEQPPLHAHRVTAEEADDLVQLAVHAVDAFEHAGLAEIIDHVRDVVQRRARQASIASACGQVRLYGGDISHLLTRFFEGRRPRGRRTPRGPHSIARLCHFTT